MSLPGQPLSSAFDEALAGTPAAGPRPDEGRSARREQLHLLVH